MVASQEAGSPRGRFPRCRHDPLLIARSLLSPKFTQIPRPAGCPLAEFAEHHGDPAWRPQKEPPP